jgi:hypothetical protein
MKRFVEEIKAELRGGIPNDSENCDFSTFFPQSGWSSPCHLEMNGSSNLFGLALYTKSLYCLCRCCVCSMRARNTGTMMPDLVL